ncbi:TetR/AcrR family transcriptional regulator [Galactobacter valiniphilus]|nr:TetR/AcrR family transcriptional regulator [Galactobacter valiniphilus]
MNAGILREGRAQLDEVGAAQLSLREIARSLGVASSALYRHVASRDELLTLLIADAYTELADAVDAALAAPGGEVPAGRQHAASGREALFRLGRAMRVWAVAHPRRWALIYGSPVPGYAAPAEGTTEAGTRVMGTFLTLTAGGTAPVSARPSPALGAFLTAAAGELGLNADAPTAVEAVGAWTALIGAISAEVFGQLGPELAPFGAELLERELERTASAFGLG